MLQNRSFAAWRKKRSESDKKAGAVAAVEGEAEQSADAAAESSRGAEKAAEGGKQEHSRAENEATSTSDQAGAAPENAHGAGSEAASQSASKRKRKVEPVEKEGMSVSLSALARSHNGSISALAVHMMVFSSRIRLLCLLKLHHGAALLALPQVADTRIPSMC